MATTFPIGVLIATIMLILLVTVNCEFSTTLTLERVFPSKNEMSIRQLRALDNARRQRLLLQSSNDIEFPLNGTYLPHVGLYYTKVQVGSPPRDFHLHIDSGSDPLWLKCASCSGCPSKTKLKIKLNSYDPEKSSTSSMLSCSQGFCQNSDESPEAFCSDGHCAYKYEYGGGTSSTSGYYISDNIRFPGANSSFPVLFGCSTEVTGRLADDDVPVDGLLGLAPGNMSVISQLSSKGLVPRVFSHCLRGDEQGGGKLILGKILDPNIVYTPLLSSVPNFYSIDMKSIEVNGKKIEVDLSVLTTPNNGGTFGTVVDSGTTVAYLPEGIYEPFYEGIMNAMSKESLIDTFDLEGCQCFLVNRSISEVFPTVNLNFAGGASMVLRPKDYLFVPRRSNLEWCLGFLKDGIFHGVILLGDVVLKDKIIVHDLVGQRLGWADYDCTKTINVSAH